MSAVPRDPAGNFLPPQSRLTTVDVREIDAGDRASWNINGKTEVCDVVTVTDEWGFARRLTLRRPDGTGFAAVVLEGVYVLKLEAKAW